MGTIEETRTLFECCLYVFSSDSLSSSVGGASDLIDTLVQVF